MNFKNINIETVYDILEKSGFDTVKQEKTITTKLDFKTTIEITLENNKINYIINSGKIKRETFLTIVYAILTTMSVVLFFNIASLNIVQVTSLCFLLLAIFLWEILRNISIQNNLSTIRQLLYLYMQSK
ncbi:Uncharacterised protein [Clostridium putrefaciens]|uniref:Uncharacterized protein n=1 Tax=Clostridium putrefaciens TaxID=99675 RepID=A0A381J8E8_9CLOT|nr:hypothetical protein [Clostridium putrefaciens]SUY46968.1 Uncharacterised protein [Clostridium putrefaciens]